MGSTYSDHAISLLAVAAALLAGLAFCHLLFRGAKNKRRAPLVGSLFHQLIHLKRIHHYHTDLAAKHGTFRLLAPFSSYLYTVEPAVVEHILRTNFANYGKGALNYEHLSDLFGDGIFAVDGEKWLQQRKLASSQFNTKNLRAYSNETFKSTVVKLAQTVSVAADSNTSMDFQDLFMRATMDSIFKVAFGVELDTLSGSNEEGTNFAKSFDIASELVLWRYPDVFWKIKRFLNIGSEATLKKHIKVIDSFVYKLIHSKADSFSKQQRDAPNYSDMEKKDLLTMILLEKKDPVDEKYLRDIVLNILIAGRDTTAVTLSWFFYMLCRHPSLQAKIFQEIEIATKVSGSRTSFVDTLTEEVLDKMQFLRAAITETLRLYPAVPEDPKICFSDDTLPNGYEVKKGDSVCYLPYSMGRMKSLWGDDAEEFQPERWLDKQGVFQPEDSFKFTTFQAGPRICIGKDFAYRQIMIISAVLVHFFNFKMQDDKEDITYRATLTLPIDGGLQLLSYKRKTTEPEMRFPDLL